MPTTRYVALLRGINVGGHKKIKMAELRELFAALGFDNVKTVLASGNVAWDAEGPDPAALRDAIAAGIEATFGFPVSVIVLPRAQVESLVESDPFAGVPVTENTRLYVTFLPEPVATTLAIPYHSPDNAFTILRATETEVYSVLTLADNARPVDAMDILEDEYGPQITTRNWNTVLKIASL
ncbi:MAG: DUF1697 domain-containing protein [Chloroflexi bacterium]|nr:DUF1697 domain-containing protein [Chloroflexota bacterium]